MSFDNSRSTFKLGNDYIGPVMLQGRVQMDADWNEWLAEIVRRTQAGTLDILGRAAYPATTPHAFEITASSSGVTNTLMIGPGRMYVDGLLAENHGDPAALEWDPALGEMSDAPQPPLPSATTGAVDYTQQPYMPPPTALPPGNGPFLAYLDVWVRPVDYINDPNLIDAAVGVDSTGRLQTAWQVQLLDLGLAGSPGATCDSPINNWPPAPSSGLLSTGTTPERSFRPMLSDVGRCVHRAGEPVLPCGDSPAGNSGSERSALPRRSPKALRLSNGRATTVRSSRA